MTETTAAKVGEVRSRALAELRPDSIDTEAGTVEAVFSTGEPRWMAGGTVQEQLRQDGADLSVVNEGAPVFKDHRHSVDAMVGRIVPGSVRVEHGKIVGRVALNKDDEVWKLVRDGFLRQFSFGYRVDEVSEESNGDGTTTVTVERWTPLEVSLVGLAAERGARVRSASDHAGQERGDSPQSGVAHRLYMARKAADEGHDDLAQRAANANISGDDAARELLTRMEEKSDATMTYPHVRQGDFDSYEMIQQAAPDAIRSMLDGKQPETEYGRQLRGLGLTGIARQVLEQRGEQGAMRMSANEIARRSMHTTSDFPQMLTEAGNRSLMERYRTQRTPLAALAREHDAQDFRPVQRLSVGSPPELEKVREGSEIKSGSTEEKAETYSIETYAKMFSLSRQAIVNDDLGVFQDYLTQMGRAAVHLEADKLAKILTDNPKLADGSKLFSADHANVANSASLDVAGVSAGRTLMRSQTDIGGKHPLNLGPAFLACGAEDETAAQQLVASITPANTDDANPFAGSLTVLPDARLDGEGKFWLFASPNEGPVIEMGFLNGNRGPQLESREGWNTLGIEFRIVFDFQAAPIDHRGAVEVPKA